MVDRPDKLVERDTNQPLRMDLWKRAQELSRITALFGGKHAKSPSEIYQVLVILEEETERLR